MRTTNHVNLTQASTCNRKISPGRIFLFLSFWALAAPATFALPNLTPYAPSGWSDKIVVSKVTGTTTDSSPLYTTDTLYVDWAVINNGTAATAARFYTALYVDGVLNNSWYTDPPLNANYYTTVTGYSIGSLSAGTHTLEIITDSTGAISESNESDNTYTKTITVSTPSLVISSLTPTAMQTLDWGGSATYTITVHDGSGNAVSGATVGIDDSVMSVCATRGPTDSNGQTTYTTTVPNSEANGTYSLQFSATKSGYTGSSTVTRQVQVSHSFPNLTPYQPSGWSDKIVVSKVTGTTTDSSPLYTTDTLYVDWAVINNGTAATAARFYTALYVDGVLNNSWYTDPPLNANYYTTVTGYSVGSLSAGTHTLEIITDSTGAISESNESDNTYTKTITVVPGTPTLVAANCYVSPATITAGGQLTVYFQIYNPNSSSISIGLGCSIRQNGTSTWLSDPANDVYKTVPSGYSTQTRYYNVPSGSLGSYDVAWGLWQTIGSGSPWDSLTQLNQFTALKTPTWVVMYYMCNGSGGGADLDQYIPAKFSTVAANLNDNIQAFMLVDRSGAGLDRVFRIRQDGNMDDYTDGVDRWTPAQIGLSGSEFDTGSINTINTFTDFVISRSGISGDHYALVIFDHGGGISPTVVGETNLPPVPTGICWDDTGDYLSVADLGNAAAHVKTLLGRNLEVLHLDACLMQMIEVNYELRNSVDYLVASENEGWAIDPSWETYVASITPATTSQALAQAIANTYFTAISGGRTIAVTRPGQAATISSAVDTLASALIQNTAVYRANIATAQNHAQKFAFCHDESWTMDPGNMFLDVRDLCQELVAVVPVTGVQTAANSVIAAIGNAGGPFLVSEQHANDSGATQNNGFWFDKGTYGLSIFFPRSPQDANCFNTYNTYNNYINQSATPANLAFTAATHWDEFLQAFFSPGNLQFASSTYSVNENGGSIRIHVSRTGGSYGAAGVSYATADGSAGAGSDYTAVSGTLSWADGDATDKYADVPIIDEGSYSGNEYFTLNLSGASGASLGSPITTTVTIIDNDTPPSRGNLQFASSAYSVNENGGSIRIYVNRTGGSYGAAGVNYATADGSAGAGSDYTAVSGTLSWVDGDAADKYVDVLIIDKGSYSGNEYFTVSLSGASGAALGSPTTTTVTITDNDTPPTACFRAPQHLANGAVQLVLDCVQGSTYWVQCSTNLASWRAIFSITPSSNVITLTDTKAIGLPLCYYRALGFSATNATPHPADLNADYTISTSEYLAYSNAYVTTGPWPIPPCPVPAAYYTNANLIWQTNGYHINPALPPPDCWVPGR